MWLFNVPNPDDPFLQPFTPLVDNEIDVFELPGYNSYIGNIGNTFYATYHWRALPDYVHLKFEECHKIVLNNYNYTGQYTLFGLEWNANFIKWYVNNKLVHEIDIAAAPPECSKINRGWYLPCIYPENYQSPAEASYTLRFGTGCDIVAEDGSSVNPNQLPVDMEIEYIRVYKKDGELASPIKLYSGIPQICITDNEPDTSKKNVLWANWYPTATYSWSSPAFDFQTSFIFQNKKPQHQTGNVKFWVKQGVTPGLYPIYLTTTFPYGHIEHDSIHIYICGDVPSQPNSTFHTQPSLGVACMWELYHQIYDNQVLNCQYSTDGGLTWNLAQIRNMVGWRYAALGSYFPGDVINIQYEEMNSCGYSAPRIATINIPENQPSDDCAQ